MSPYLSTKLTPGRSSESLLTFSSAKSMAPEMEIPCRCGMEPVTAVRYPTVRFSFSPPVAHIESPIFPTVRRLSRTNEAITLGALLLPASELSSPKPKQPRISHKKNVVRQRLSVFPSSCIHKTLIWKMLLIMASGCAPHIVYTKQTWNEKRLYIAFDRCYFATHNFLTHYYFLSMPVFWSSFVCAMAKSSREMSECSPPAVWHTKKLGLVMDCMTIRLNMRNRSKILSTMMNTVCVWDRRRHPAVWHKNWM